MTMKYQRPEVGHEGAGGLANRAKYRDDAAAVPKRAISSTKVDGDFNYVVDALNEIDEASGSRASIAERMGVSLNPDGTLRVSVTATLDEWVPMTDAGLLTRIGDTSFSMAGGNFTGLLKEGRRVRITVSGSDLVADVVSSSFGSGVTTVVVTELVNSAGTAAVIGVAPTAVAYGPLTGGVQANAPRRMVKGVTVPIGAVDYRIGADGSDLVVDRGGSVVARFGSSGMTGLAVSTVDIAQLATAVVNKLVPIGIIVPFAAGAPPTGWLLCDGRAVNRFTYPDLFTVIGTTYGAGNGTSTFNLPDLRGRVTLGLDNIGGTDAGRLSGFFNTLGAGGGAQTKTGTTAGHTLTVDEIPAHAHQVLAEPAVQGSGGGAGWLNAAAPTGIQGGTGMTSVGGGAAHTHGFSVDVLPPYILINHIIKA